MVEAVEKGKTINKYVLYITRNATRVSYGPKCSCYSLQSGCFCSLDPNINTSGAMSLSYKRFVIALISGKSY